MRNNINFLVIISVVVVLCSCSKRNSNKIIDNQVTIINQFKSKSVLRSRGHNIIILNTIKSNKKNAYYFQIDKSKLVFLSETIEYTPEQFLTKQKQDSLQYQRKLADSLSLMLKTMDNLEIRDIESDLSDIGINLKIYLKGSKGVLLYISDVSAIKGEFWSSYINSYEKLNENWFYSKSGR